jgi:hypothetical protein
VKHCIGQAGIQARLLHIQAVLWNPNYFLRFRFRLLTSSGSGSIGKFFQKTLEKILPFLHNKVFYK